VTAPLGSGPVFATTHVVVGALLARTAPSASAALVLGLASHPVLDALPHWGLADRHGDPRDRRTFHAVAVVDGLAALAASGLLLRREADPVRTAAGMVGGLALDLDKPGELVGLDAFYPSRLADWHTRIQRFEQPRRWWCDALATLSAALVLRRPSRRPAR
jgi:hypothetical protein